MISGRSGNCNQRYINCPRDISKLTFLIHGPGHFSEQWKLLDDFGIKYAVGRPFKDIRHEPTTTNICLGEKEVSDMVQHTVDEILQEDIGRKLSAKKIDYQDNDTIKLLFAVKLWNSGEIVKCCNNNSSTFVKWYNETNMMKWCI